MLKENIMSKNHNLESIELNNRRETELKEENIVKEINNEEYYFAEFEIKQNENIFKGVLLVFRINNIKPTYEDLEKEINGYRLGTDLVPPIYNEFKNASIAISQINLCDTEYISLILPNIKLDKNILNICERVKNNIQNYYEEKNYHITRMFGSYILLKNVNDKLKAVAATPIPIKHCPLMVKLLKEVGGKHADELLKSLKEENPNLQSKMMCKLINEVVIDGGYFDTNRPLNSCEANVLFGASETMASAFKEGIIDAAVIVSNNLGTIITTNDSNTQGAVKRMTGLFHTSPSKKLIKTANKAGIDVVFPYTASIDQLEGVKKAIRLGYKNIAVSVAAEDNYLHEKLKELEKDGVKIYKFGLCSTGISEETAEIMMNHADVVWSCASKYVKSHIAPNAIAQVGIKIPVHIMTADGWNIVSNHLKYMDSDLEIDNINLTSGEEEPVFLNSNGIIKKMKKKDVRHCSDCPHPCV